MSRCGFHRNDLRVKALRTTYLLALTFMLFSPSPAQVDPLKIHQTQINAIKLRQKTQVNEENWAQKKTELKARYQSLKAEKTSLEKKKALLEEQIAILKDREAQSKRKMAESALIKKGLQSHLDTVIARLEENMTSDLPFLTHERTERLERVKSAMVQPDTRIAEKCRQVMETLKIETEYGQTVAVYQAAIRIGKGAAAQPVMADILRVGRLALFWQTPDGKTVGHWDRIEGAWATLPNKYRRHINDATQMARKLRTVDMVKLPLGRIVRE